MASPKMKIRIGDLMVQNGVISEQQLTSALARQKETRQKLGRSLVSLGYVDEQQFLEFLAQQLSVPLVDLSHYNFKQEDVLRLSETHARRFRSIVLKENPDHFLVGMSDPLDIFAFDELQRLLPKTIELAVVAESQLLQTLDLMYRRTNDIDSLADQLSEDIVEDSFDLSRLTATDETDAPVVRLLKSIFEDAVQVGASDIHIEPDEHVLRIRQRVDGVLHEHVMKETRIAAVLVLRLKLMAELNISEKRLPQDGRFNITVKNHNVDVRISTLPIQHGESVVMRLLDQSAGLIDLNNAGLPPRMLAKVRRIIHEPHGLLLVTGPTGSGKTTTLYGALNELNDASKKIITVEDPVEYRLSRVNQVQVHPQIGLTFSKVLRSCLRQDPDILLVGEIRDLETADIAMRAAMTGHFVLSTLHTNDAISSAMRLVDIGVEGYLAGTALRGILAQRLVRRICENCKEPHIPTAQEQVWLDIKGEEAQLQITELKHGKGCTYCNNTGYKGRVGIFELLEMNDEMADALRRNDNSAFSQAARSSEGYQPLVMSALAMASQGITSLQEVFRVTEQMDESAYLESAETLSPAQPDSHLELE
ncbi:GspE/PulE family protein [Neptunomonas qingdaonensis]|uniref:MSHA biogenesis protein MshE n=1 Tax=Neptunomonas qingdaonensis TaxID=1045558 RepID=A0A1I2VBN2_9GAMM|nr:ATPase, T2SS/T4P/T4SS family [Neptunomonas qingdaonensis]SFG85849.1 MSHA biogenesis protein MshE [Neptunomonas qingdaonensis]